MVHLVAILVLEGKHVSIYCNIENIFSNIFAIFNIWTYLCYNDFTIWDFFLVDCYIK